MEVADVVRLVEQSEGLVLGGAELSLGIVGVVAVISAIVIAVICYKGEVSEGGLLMLVAWFFFASPVTFYFASGALSALFSYQEAYIQSIWYKAYGEEAFQDLSWGLLWARSQSIATNLDTSLLMKVELYKAAHGFFKFFVPAVLAALGAWGVVKYLDARVRVVS